MSENIEKPATGEAVPLEKECERPAPNEKTVLVCRPGGKWSTEVIA